jgi:hypothetical protein
MKLKKGKSFHFQEINFSEYVWPKNEIFFFNTKKKYYITYFFSYKKMVVESTKNEMNELILMNK